MKVRDIVVATAAVMTLGASAAMADVVLDFAGLPSPFIDNGPLNYYAGGLSLLGDGPGPNYGVSFTANAFLCATQHGDPCDTLVASPPPANLLFFASGDPSFMDAADGFTTLAISYSSFFGAHSVDIYSGLDGGGTLLATLDLPDPPDGSTVPACGGASICPFVVANIALGGVAHSVDFGASVNDVSFESFALGSNVAAIPEPLTLALFGAGLAGAGTMRRRGMKKA